MQAPVNPNGSSACNCHLISGPFTGRQWQLCSFGRDGSWPETTKVGQRQAYTPCLSPLEHSQVPERKSVTLHVSERYFMQRVKFCSCFCGGNKSRRRSCFPKPILIHSLLAALLQRICSEQKNTDLRRHPRDWDAELLSYISKDCTLKSHSQLWEISVL